MKLSRYTLAAALAVSTLSGTIMLQAADEPKAAAPAAANILKPTADVKNWRLEQHEEAKATAAVADGALVFDVTKDDGTDWHVQAFQTPISLKDGTEYIVTFQAKADAERAIKVQAGIDQDDWHLIGLDEEITLGKEFKAYEYKFTASETVANKNRFGFVLGQAKGNVYVKDVVVKPAK